MGELSVILGIKDKQFNEKIESAKRSVKGFSGEAVGALSKMMGALAAAALSYKTLQGAIESTDSTSDKFAATVEQARSSLDFFLTSVATANFSNFWDGLKESTRLAREFFSELDSLEDARMGFGVLKTEIGARIAENRAVLNDPYSTEGEKNKALALLKEQETKLIDLTEIIKDKSRATADALISNAANMAFTPAEIERFKYYLAGSEKGLYDLADERDRLKKEWKAGMATSVQTSSIGGRSYTEQTEESKAAEAALKSLEEKNKADIAFLDKINRVNQTEREAWAKLEQEYSGYSTQLSEIERLINREERKRVAEIGKGGKGIEIIPSGSLTELEAKLKEARKAFANATTNEARAAADTLIKELEAKKVVLSVEFKLDNPGDIKPGAFAPIKTGGKLDAIQEIGKLESEITKAENSLIGLTDPTRIKKLNSEIKTLKENVSLIKDANSLNISVPDMSGVFQNNNKGAKNWIDIMCEMGEINNDIAGSIGAIGRALDNEAGAWLNWGANVLSSIGQAIPAIAALTTAKTAEATANTASAASGAASSVASIPYVGPIMAVAAVASIIAALASVPKFASGGIVPGISFAGDNMLARVNSGEMILNQQQQANLLDMIKIGGSARGDNPGTGGNVTFELAGTKLIGAINNTIAKQNRTGARRPLL